MANWTVYGGCGRIWITESEAECIWGERGTILPNMRRWMMSYRWEGWRQMLELAM